MVVLYSAWQMIPECTHLKMNRIHVIMQKLQKLQCLSLQTLRNARNTLAELLNYQKNLIHLYLSVCLLVFLTHKALLKWENVKMLNLRTTKRTLANT